MFDFIIVLVKCASYLALCCVVTKLYGLLY